MSNSLVFDIDNHYVERTPTDHWFKFFLHILKKYKFAFIFITLLSFATSVELFLITRMIENFTTWFGEIPNYITLLKLGKNLLYIVIIYIFTEGCSRLANHLNGIFLPFFEGTVRILLNKIFLNYPYEFFIIKGEGEIVDKIQNFTDGLSDIFEFISGTLIPSILQIIISCYFIGCRNITYLLVFFIWIIISIASGIYLSYFCSKNSQYTLMAQAKLAQEMIDLYSNIFVIKAFRIEKSQLDYYIATQKDETKQYNKFLRSVNTMRFVFSCLYIFAHVLLGNFFLLYCWYNNLLNPSDVVFLFSTSSMAAYVVWMMLNELPQIFTAVGQCKSSFALLQEYAEKKIKGRELEYKNFLGDIEFQNISYKNILHNISFSIKAGDKIAIIGASGSGKSTILSLLLRIINPSSGTILIDNNNIANFTEDVIKKNISIVTQDSLIFNRSIKDNVDFGEKFSDEQIKDALYKAHMDKFIEIKPEKENFQVGNKGRRLSGGQKQRLNIARVFARDPSIIICDEAGSALDPITEFNIMKNLFEVYKNRTIIFVTHNITITQNLDLIICLENGKIAEVGSPDKLKMKKGIYFNMLNTY